MSAAKTDSGISDRHRVGRRLAELTVILRTSPDDQTRERVAAELERIADQASKPGERS